jgi:mevalonate kinase
MPIVFGKAPGKIILFGEHAVVYGQPAIAIPVTNVNATARIIPNLDAEPGHVRIEAVDIQLNANLDTLSDDHPLAAAVWLTLHEITPNHTPSFTLQISSSIPMSAGMGSGAAISVAIIRALSAFLGKPLPDSKVSELAFEVEKIHHGTPSGIDNSVVTYQKPVYFKRDEPIQMLKINHPTHWLIADTGEKTPTRETVSAVRALHAEDAETYGAIFRKIGDLTEKARQALIAGDLTTLGLLMDENQHLLEDLRVSSESLETLIQTARNAGAAGAKLSGSGRGGNMIALASPEKIRQIETALLEAGAVKVITTVLREDKP